MLRPVGRKQPADRLRLQRVLRLLDGRVVDDVDDDRSLRTARKSVTHEVVDYCIITSY